jgi:glutamyl-tRNA reductase
LRLSVVGISHHVAPVELRERVALPLDRAALLARDLGDAVCLSTCNRTEVYLASEDELPALSSLEQLAGESLNAVAYRMHDEAAAVHLFRVSAGLDSLVPGESEILGQVRAAYDAARPGPFLDRVFRQALALGKRVRAETAIGESPASVPAAAAALAQQVFGDLTGRRVLLVGAGRVGELAAGSLSARGASIAYVANRSREAAAQLAERFGGEALSLDEVPGRLGDVDVVLAATGSPAAIGDVDGCYRADVGDAEAGVAETLAGRRVEAEHAERLVALEAERFKEWRASLEVVPAIASLRARAEEIRTTELAKLGELPDDERRTLEAVTVQILNKLLHLPTVRMKEAAAGADGARYTEAVRHLFGLEEDKP